MSKSAAGTAENPGKNVAQKSGLNKAILDQGWGEFRRQLDYKLLACGDGALRPSMKQEPTEGAKPYGLAPVGIPFL